MDWDGESDDASRFSKDVMTAVNPKQIPPCAGQNGRKFTAGN